MWRFAGPIVAAAILVIVAAGCSTTPSAPTSPGAGAAATTSATPGTPAPATPMSSGAASSAVPGPVVVLDPGHDGGNAAHAAAIGRPVPDGRGGTKPCNTTGTATAAGYPEHAFTWDVTMRLARRLTAAGITVRTTRPDDRGVGPCVDRRAALADAAGAVAVVSVHADGATPGGHGFHVATSSPALAPSQGAPSASLAADLVAGLRGGGFVPSTYRGHGGLDPRDDLAGLNLARTPAALVECANMRNPAEASLVSSPDGRERYAAALADGIRRWVGR